MIETVLSKLILNSDEDLPEELFFRGQLQKKEGDFCAYGKVSFDTYFNLFSVRKIKEYTQVMQLMFMIEAKGKGNLTLYSIGDNGEKELISKSIESEKYVNIRLLDYIDIDLCGEYIYLKIESERNDLFVREAKWIGNVKELNNVSLACCFCTYKREADICRNIKKVLEAIEEEKKFPYSVPIHIYIADNGHTLGKKNVGFDSEKLHIYKNKNYGGSAGFTRCIIEAKYKSLVGFTHYLLLDDDALIEPYVLNKITSLLRILKPEYKKAIIGGAMFSKSNPLIQKENSAFLTGYGIGELIVHDSNMNMKIKSNIIHNEDPKDSNYNAWFCCCIPDEIIRKDNLPLPLFIHGDDQEYGIRNFDRIMTMNGIAVWHPDMYGNYRPYIKYYDHRNGLILSAEFNPNMSFLGTYKLLIKSCLSSITKYRYDEAWYTLRGINDFYKGMTFFSKINAEKLNRQILAWKKADYVQEYKEKGYRFDQKIKQNQIQAIILLILNVFIPAYRGSRVYENGTEWHQIHYFGTKSIEIIDIGKKERLVFTKNSKEALKIAKAALKLMRKIAIVHREVYRNWYRSIPKLQQLSYWEKILNETDISA